MANPPRPPSADAPAIDYYARLNPRQQRFVDHLVLSGNQTQSYIAAGYNAAFPEQQASDLMRDNPFVSLAIATKKAEFAARAAVSQDAILAEIKSLAFCNPAEAFEPHEWSLKAPEALPEALQRALSVVQTSETHTEHGLNRKASIRFADKLAALTRLGDFLGLWDKSKSRDQSGMELHIHMTQAQAQVTVVPVPSEPLTRGSITILPSVSVPADPDAETRRK